MEQFEYETKHIMELDKSMLNKAYDFCEDYKKFMKKCKTERECVDFFIDEAIKKGYKEYNKNTTKLESGNKYYYNNRGKAIALFTIGSEKIDKGINFSIAHIDSPRLDLKPNPMYENSEIAFLKTHYYGGIKKYQWVTIPLSLHGVIFLSNGKELKLNIGEKESDTQFVITDLLPHLSDEQNKRTLKDVIKGEELNVIIGSIPFVDKDILKEKNIKNFVKHKILYLLNEQYGINEKDFLRCEIEITPALNPSDIGFDRSMVGAYAQDDRVCAYPAFIAETECNNPSLTSMTVLTDKEEIGSEGNTGMVSNYVFDLFEDICDYYNIKARDVYKNSLCFSSDVNAAYDPTFADVFEERNASLLNHGVTICKYTGSRGKSGAQDASAETMNETIRILDESKVPFQVAELGKVDIGGGGTIAKFVSQRNIDTVDIGVPVLSMHSPFEITSKLDIYSTYLAYKALLRREKR
ncbi:MAG: aminopeptidase [Eubacteriales bacterium]|nr:aminopeptidase [Eubacteriales bacterium]